jgi:hypothetical protein
MSLKDLLNCSIQLKFNISISKTIQYPFSFFLPLQYCVVLYRQVRKMAFLLKKEKRKNFNPT